MQSKNIFLIQLFAVVAFFFYSTAEAKTNYLKPQWNPAKKHLSISKVNKLSSEQSWDDLGLFGGQVLSLSMDASNPSRIFASTYNGDGIFLSEDDGNTWHSVTGFRNNICRQVEVASLDTRNIWVIHDYFISNSTDKGASWKKRETPQNRLTESIAIDPVNNSIVYVGTGGENVTYENGAIYKTTDGGASWKKLSIITDKSVTRIRVSPSDTGTVWALTGFNEPGSVYKSDDAGSTWRRLHTGYEGNLFNDIEVHPEFRSIAFIAFEKGILITKNSGNTWEKINILNPVTGLEDFFAGTITIDRYNPERIYTATNYGIGGDNTLFRSNDSGKTWYAFNTGYMNFFDLSVHPYQNNILYGADGNNGIFKSTDHGETWTLINEGLSANIVFDSAFDPNRQDVLLVAALGGLYKKDKQGQWTQLSHSSTYSLAFDPINTNTIFAGFAYTIGKSTDYGKEWSYTILSLDENPSFFKTSSISIDGSNNNLIYASVAYESGIRGEIYKSTNNGDAFEFVSYLDSPINTVTTDPGNSDIVYAGTGRFLASSHENQGHIFRSINGGRDWDSLLHYGSLVVNEIAINPSDTNIIYAACGSSGTGDAAFYKSVDGGTTWKNKYYLDSAFTDIKIKKDLPSTLFVASFKNGIFQSVDGGENWVAVGLPDYYIFDLTFNNYPSEAQPLLAGTNSGMAAFSGGSLSGFIFDKTGVNTLYPSTVFLDTGDGQIPALVFDSGAYLLLAPPVGNNYALYCSSNGYTQQEITGINIGSLDYLNYDFHLNASTSSSPPSAPELSIDKAGTSISIFWKSVSNAAGYKLFYAPYPDASFIGEIDMGTTLVLSFDAKGLAFYVAVQAYNDQGSSPFSNIDFFDLAK